MARTPLPNRQRAISIMTKETITISKDEYIDLLHCKSLLMERELAASEPVALPPRKPHSWMNVAEKSEILQMAELGFRPGEISQKIGRPISTVSRWIRKQRNTLETGSVAGHEPA